MSDQQPSKWEEWTKPQVIMSGFGYIGLLVGAWLSFDGRIAENRAAIVLNGNNDAYARELIELTREDLDKINAKLDRVIERQD